MGREELARPLEVDPDLPKDLEEVDGATRVLKIRGRTNGGLKSWQKTSTLLRDWGLRCLVTWPDWRERERRDLEEQALVERRS